MEASKKTSIFIAYSRKDESFLRELRVFLHPLEQNKQVEIWYDGEKSLTEKYRYVKQKKLAGISIWALGYDHGEQNLWQLLANEFGQKRN